MVDSDTYKSPAYDKRGKPNQVYLSLDGKV